MDSRAVGGCNAVGQSMLWTPVVRILALTYQDAARERASFILSLISVLAYVAAWLLAGLITSYIGWRQAFCPARGSHPCRRTVRVLHAPRHKSRACGACGCGPGRKRKARKCPLAG